MFINVGLISSLNSSHHHSSVKKHVSSNVKRRKSAEVQDKCEYVSSEICEETSGDENQFKLNPFILVVMFYSHIESKLKDTLKKITPFNKYFSYDSSNRYLEYRVFRI